jgi:hypothetical protein
MKNPIAFLLAVTAALSGVEAGSVTEPPAEPAKPRSFLAPVGGFFTDSILRPTHPFELVPGKDPDAWGFVLEPYLWGASMSGTAGIAPLPALGVDLKTRKILENLKFGVMGAGEIRKGRWGLLADGIYMDLEASGKLGGTLYRSGRLEISQALASLALAYRVIDDRRGYLDLYAGARYNFLGMDVSLNIDPDGITQAADDLTNRLQAGIADTVAGILAGKQDVLVDQVSAQAQAALGGGRAQELAKPSAELRELIGERALDRILQPNRGALAEFIAAQAAAKAAAAKGQLTAALQNRVNTAKAKLSRELADALEDNLPTGGSKDIWWVDPIIGLRGQVNITRWLFVAAQADVGGFGAGSQIAWNVLGSVGINFTRNFYGEIGYRYIDIDYDRDGFLYDMNTLGAFSALGFRF